MGAGLDTVGIGIILSFRDVCAVVGGILLQCFRPIAIPCILLMVRQFAGGIAPHFLGAPYPYVICPGIDDFLRLLATRITVLFFLRTGLGAVGPSVVLYLGDVRAGVGGVLLKGDRPVGCAPCVSLMEGLLAGGISPDFLLGAGLGAVSPRVVLYFGDVRAGVGSVLLKGDRPVGCAPCVGLMEGLLAGGISPDFFGRTYPIGTCPRIRDKGGLQAAGIGVFLFLGAGLDAVRPSVVLDEGDVRTGIDGLLLQGQRPVVVRPAVFLVEGQLGGGVVVPNLFRRTDPCAVRPSIHHGQHRFAAVEGVLLFLGAGLNTVRPGVVLYEGGIAGGIVGGVLLQGY